MFGIMTMHLYRLVNYGNSFNDSESLFLLLQAHPLNRSVYHLFKPQRKILKFPKPDNPQLKRLHLLQYDLDCGEAIGKIHSDIGTSLKLYSHGTEGLSKIKGSKKGIIDEQNGKI